MLRFISLGMEQPVREEEYSPPPDSEGKNRSYVSSSPCVSLESVELI
jgi:hypothetical protein